MSTIPSQMTIGSANNYGTEETTQRLNSDLNMEQFLYIIANAMSMPSFDGGSGGGNETDYIGQMVQFGMLNAMTEMTEVMETTMLMTQQQQALSLVGKEVTLAGEEASLVTGIVEKVRFENGYATIQVNGKEYSLSEITEVGNG